MYKILIASDDILMQEAFGIMIAGEDEFKVIQMLDTGEKAVELCKKSVVDLLFMDMQMPGMTVIEASRMIHESSPEIVIYILSAHAAGMLIRNLVKDSVKDVLEKPITYDRLKKILDHYKTEHEDSVRDQFMELSEILRNKDFKQFYESIIRIIDEIYEIADNDSLQLIKIFTYIGQNLLDTRDFYDENKNITELFPINEGLILEKKTSELWIFRVIDYLFRQNSVKRYPLLENIFLYIDKHIKEEITLNAITEDCAISQGYLSRIFREQFQVSVTEYLHMKKLHLAKGYFYFTEKSIAEVAFCLGYNESSYFSKVFKKYEDMTVKEYKKAIRKK